MKLGESNEAPRRDTVYSHVATSPLESLCRTARYSSSSETNISAPRSTPAASFRSKSTPASEHSYLRTPAPFLSPRSNFQPSAIGKTSDVTDHHSSQMNSGRHAPRIQSTTLISDSSASFQARRTHAVLQGQLVPVMLPPKGRGFNDKLPAPSQTISTDAIIAVVAQPLLQTARGFPFDMRQSRVEAGRISNASLGSP